MFSNRTSIHVHVNVSDMEVKEWFTFLFLWVLYEDALIHFCGEERKGNLFCLSSRDAEGLLFKLEEFARDGQIYEFNDNYRYSAVNTTASVKYGSLEFRSMRGTLDIEVLNKWLSTLYCLRQKAIEIGSPALLIDIVLDDEKKFTRELFGEEHFIYDFPELSRSVSSNAFRCAAIIDGVKWDFFEFIDEPNVDI